MTTIQDRILDKKKTVITHHNLHSLYILSKNPTYKLLHHDVDYTYIDGLPIAILARLSGYPVSNDNRFGFMDFIYPLMNEANKNKWSIFYLGSKPGVASKAVQILKKKYHTVELHEHHGYFDINSSENEEVIKKINQLNPQILLVGMGMPRQEFWIYDNLSKLNATVIMPCGACYDYIAGEIPIPPRWVARIGLEWLYRFLSEPKRLFSRYFIEPFHVLIYLLKFKSK